MATVFDQDFSGFSPGATNITNFINVGGVVVDFGTMTGSSSATGFYERSGHGISVTGIPAFFHCQTEVSATQVTWAGWSDNGTSTPMLALDNSDLSTGSTANQTYHNLMACKINDDLTMSLIVESTQGGGLFQGKAVVVTTPEQVIFPRTWQYFQAIVQFGTSIVAGTGYVNMTATVSIDNYVALVGTATTSLAISALWTVDAETNQWRYYTSGFKGYLADITAISPAGAINTWPHPGIVRDAFVTQGVVEYMSRQNINTAYVTQGAVEMISRQNLRYAQITQGVVEIIGKFTTGRWWVYES